MTIYLGGALEFLSETVSLEIYCQCQVSLLNGA